jgi:hypothetical protein
VEQTYEPMYKNRIRGIRGRTSWQLTTKSISIKGTGCKFGGCVRKAVELTSGDLPLVPESGLRMEQSILTGRQKSAEGVIVRRRMKARTVPARVDGSGK